MREVEYYFYINYTICSTGQDRVYISNNYKGYTACYNAMKKKFSFLSAEKDFAIGRVRIVATEQVLQEWLYC